MNSNISVSYVHQTFPRVEKVILTQVSRGEGVLTDPCRTVEQVHHQDGTFIAERDPCVDVDKMKRKLALAEKLLRYLRNKHEALGDADRERIDCFFDPEPIA